MTRLFIRLPSRPRSRRRRVAQRLTVAIATATMAAGGAQPARAQCSLTNTLSGLTPTSAGAGGFVDSGTFTDPGTGATTTIGAVDPTLPTPPVPPAGSDSTPLPTPPTPPDVSTDPTTGLDLNVVAGDGQETNALGPGTNISDGTSTATAGVGDNVTDSVDPSLTLEYDSPAVPAVEMPAPPASNWVTPVDDPGVEVLDPQPPPVNSGPAQDQAVLPNTTPGTGG